LGFTKKGFNSFKGGLKVWGPPLNFGVGVWVALRLVGLNFLAIFYIGEKKGIRIHWEGA